jgi:hypothetical protein
MPSRKPPSAETALYDGYGKVEASIAQLAALRHAIAGTLTVPAAEVLIEGIEDDFDAIAAKLAAAKACFEHAIARAETV